MTLRVHAAALIAAITLCSTTVRADGFQGWPALLHRAYDGALAYADAASRVPPPLPAARADGVAGWPALLHRAYDGALAYADAALHLPRPPSEQAEAGGDPALRALIAAASERFDVPELWIRAVMQIESDGDPAATSPKGAMGLMQVMPQTYAYLSDRYGLGKDPYAQRDNVLAGSAYLREMYDRYGAVGFIAAYNAGPGRYEDCLASGRALPYETQRYVASVRLAMAEALFGKSNAPFYEPIAISPKGELLLGRTGEPMPVADRLALHSLVAKAAQRAAAK
jgi:soluble lytic murein transglycosylase-like protein